MESENKRIVKNTLMLYFRQILILLTSLYTVRIVLQALGAEDYGIYNVVAGTVTMFGFLTNSLAGASQRFFSFELGQGNCESLQKIFSLMLAIYILLAITILFFAETVGLWFVKNKLTIPATRINAAVWVYQASIFSFIISILTTPYMAAIIARENMKIYAYASVIEAILKFLVALSLSFMPDKLIAYGFLLLIITFLNTAVYRIYCGKHYKECHFVFYWDKEKFKEIVSYSCWNLFGSSISIIKNQIMNILLNIFFNPVVNAARSISVQVNNAVNSFAGNFTTAMRPQIIKQYAAGKNDKAIQLVFYGCKYTFFLMYIFALPLILEMNYILKLWLSRPPEMAVIFTRLALIDVVIASVSYQIMTLAQATGKIRLYQSVVGGILLLNLPVSYIVLKLGAAAYSVMIVAIVISIVATIIRLLILRLLVSFSIKKFLRDCILPIFSVVLIASVIPCFLHYIMEENFFRVCIVFISAIFLTLLSIITFGLSHGERKVIFINIKNKILGNNK